VTCTGGSIAGRIGRDHPEESGSRKPMEGNDLGTRLFSPCSFRRLAAKRPNSIRRVLSGCSMWDKPGDRLFGDPSEDHGQAQGSEVERNGSDAATAKAPVHGGDDQVSAIHGTGVLPIPRDPGQRGATEGVSTRRAAIMDAPASAAQSAEPLGWERFLERLGVLIPEVQILHPYPGVRFAATHPR
jgi:hypothetical protein